jgi:hypothetical protein
MKKSTMDQEREERKLNFLETLKHLGFEDARDADAPGLIVYPTLGLRIDVSSVSLRNFAAVIYDMGKQKGDERAKQKVREALGI